MKLYKLKHLPTGLFFTPSKGSGNLSKKGKIYIDIKPRFEWVGNIRISFRVPDKNLTEFQMKVIEYFNIDIQGQYIVDKYFKTEPSDWEINEIGNEK